MQLGRRCMGMWATDTWGEGVLEHPAKAGGPGQVPLGIGAPLMFLLMLVAGCAPAQPGQAARASAAAAGEPAPAGENQLIEHLWMEREHDSYSPDCAIGPG